jgi:peptide deformylase
MQLNKDLNGNSMQKIILSMFLVLIALPLHATSLEENNMPEQRPFVGIDDENCTNSQVLRTPARKVSFPISAENRRIADEMMARMIGTDNCAGLAAPQLGYDVRIIVYNVTEDAFRLREDADAIVPPSLLINPSYTPLSDEKRIDWEGCFSVKHSMGEVRRFVEIAYEGYDLDGNKVSGRAKGFLARLLQHEIDHINGTLCSDRFEEGLRYGPIEEMCAIRRQEIAARNAKK